MPVALHGSSVDSRPNVTIFSLFPRRFLPPTVYPSQILLPQIMPPHSPHKSMRFGPVSQQRNAVGLPACSPVAYRLVSGH